MSFHLTHAAVEDLMGIGRYTQSRWGRDQRDYYLGKLDAAFHDLDEMPGLGQACDHYRAGYRQYLVGKHWVFYRQVSEEDIEIVRILHERMDAPRYFV